VLAYDVQSVKNKTLRLVDKI